MGGTASQTQSRRARPVNGYVMLIVIVLLWIGSLGLLVLGAMFSTGILIGVGIAGMILFPLLCYGLKIVNPNEAMILTLFGNYYGTILKEGFYYVNPFTTSFNPTEPGKNGIRKTVSLKSTTLNNGIQKVNDVLGNPVIIGAVVIWKVTNPTKAVFNIENYSEFLSIQTDSTIRNIAMMYPYDLMDDEAADSEKTLRGSAQEIAESMREELASRVEAAGLEIEEVRITHLSYAEEIAAAMLQRQQATAIIAARQKIVEGAVSMVKMAIDKLGEDDIVLLDEERKAAMVSNLLVVLCSGKDAQPVVNSGSINKREGSRNLQEKKLHEKEELPRQKLEKIHAMEQEIQQKEKELKLREKSKKQIVLRLSPSLWEEIARWADEDFRSINGQIEFLLTECVRQKKKGKPDR